MVGVDAWSIGCVDVRFNGDADRGVRGDDPGSELVDFMGVRKGGESREGEGEGEGERVGVLDLEVLGLFDIASSSAD